MTEKQIKINALVKVLHDGKIDDNFLHSEVNEILKQSNDYDRYHPHSFDRNEKDNTKGYPTVMGRR